MLKPMNGLTDWSAIVIVLGPNSQTVMVLNLSKEDPIWKFPGGKKDGDEEAKGTAIRELKEETGIKVEKKDLKLVLEIDKSGHINPHTVFVFTASMSSFKGFEKKGKETDSELLVEVIEVKKLVNKKKFLAQHKKWLKEILKNNPARK